MTRNGRATINNQEQVWGMGQTGQHRAKTVERQTKKERTAWTTNTGGKETQVKTTRTIEKGGKTGQHRKYKGRSDTGR